MPPTTRSPTTLTPTTQAPTTALATTTEAAAVFISVVTEIDSETEARMGASHRQGCPVALDSLRLVQVSHWDFGGQQQLGELVVHVDHAAPISGVFEKLFEAKFAIQQMELVDVYGADDDLSMAANNTSAYNCREVAWRPGVWSNHAFGAAIDINPLVNPYVKGATVLPPGGASYVDRTTLGLGQIGAGDVVVEAFAAIGWTWGGDWVNSKDYQHFDYR